MSHTTAWELADRVLAQLAPLGQQDIHVFGPKWRMVSRLGLGTGAITQVREMLALGADCLLVTDDGIATWREGAWAQDAGVPLIVVNHAVAELPGIRGLAQHLRERFLDVPVTLVAEACGYEILANERQRDDGVRMRRDTLDDLPPVVVPKGYSLRPMAADEAWAYVQVMNRSNLGGRGDAGWFERTYASDPAYDSSFLQLIWRGDRPVAAAGAWHNTLDGEPWGMIHWVGVDQDARGRGLGKAVTLAALHRLRERGFERAFLGTHAWRLPAIAAYLSLGFRPWPCDPPIVYVGGQARWDQIARDLDTWRAGR
jgi:ribosomal protein S18 acetylase RimI-like enzyme